MESSSRPTGFGIAMLILLVIVAVAGLTAAFVTRNAPPPQATTLVRTDPPSPVVSIKPPVAPAAMAGEQDLRQSDGDDLLDVAKKLMAAGDWKQALAYQHWGLEATQRGRYELARCYAQLGQHEAAIYWLQQAALEDGVLVETVRQDPLWKPVRAQKSWKALDSFLEECTRHWRKSRLRDTVDIRPVGHTADEKIPALVVLPPNGDCPSNYVRRRVFQPLADQLGLTVVGLSGPVSNGPHVFSWDPDLLRNESQIRQAMENVMTGPKYELGRLIAVGFGEGGPLAFELTAKHPRFFAGSIVVSPQASTVKFEGLKRDELHERRGFILINSPDDPPEVRELTLRYADWANTVQAPVLQVALPGNLTGVPSAEFLARLPQWVESLQSATKGNPLTATSP